MCKSFGVPSLHHMCNRFWRPSLRHKVHFWTRFQALFAAGVGLLLAVCRIGYAGEQPPNIVLIVSDDQCWTDYSFMGHAHVQTPCLDKLAAQSLLYKRGYVPSSLCCPSLASIITGRYPHEHRITGNDPPTPAGTKRNDPQYAAAFREGREALNRHLEAVPTLPRLLAQRGYLSFQSGKWWQGDFSRGGFTHGMTKGQRHGDEGLKIGRATLQPIYDFIETARKDGKPFLVWYAPMMPHDPHTPPQRLFDKYKDKTPSPHVARYWAMVEWFDETCGELLGHLDKQGLAENTIVVYVTDNGWIQDPDSPRYGKKSKQSPYDGGLRTPIMIRWPGPGKVKPRESGELATSLDLLPTLLNAAGMKPVPGLPGIDLLDDEAVRKRKSIFGECFEHTIPDLDDPAKGLRWRWAIDERWKLIVPKEPDKPSELYDIQADPKEEKDLAAREPAAVQALRGKLDEWWKP